MRFPAALLALIAISAPAVAADKPAPDITVEEIPSPAAPRSLGAALTTAPDGTLWLSWVEPAHRVRASAARKHGAARPPPGDANTLRTATFEAAAGKWSAPRTIATATSVTTSSADFPQLVIDGRGHAFAVWTDGHGGALVSESADRGTTWSAPHPWTRDGNEVEKFSFVTLADGRVLAAWLDARGRKDGGKMQQLYTRIVGETGSDLLVDHSVCDCCQTTLTAFPDGGALLAYRGRTDQEVRDIRVTRFRGHAWDEPRPLNNDDWRINACPVNGPRLASDGGRVAVAWFTAADNDPRVLASFSPDAGARFLMPLRIDRGHPTGHVDTLILHDGAMLVTWVENDGSVWLRRISPEFTVGVPWPLAPAGTTSVKTVPRLALLRDYRGGKIPAQIVATFARERAPATLATLLVSVPEGELLEAETNCDCAPTPEQLQGFPIRGTIIEARPAAGVLQVKHFELPGVFPEGQREFKVAPDLLGALPAGRQFLARIERRAGVWWLFDIKLLAAPK